VLAALLVLGLRIRAGTDHTAADSPLIGRPAPDFSLPLLGEPARRLGNRDLLGEPFVLEVWSSRCPGCDEAQPVVAALANEGQVRVVRYILGDPGDTALRLARDGNPYFAVVVDADGRAARAWGIRRAPEAYLVDARGIVRWKHSRPLTTQVVAEDILPTLESAR
jgi:cytochrome c biogenesis protein CcmG/thiol:disulfide interchange protein DsbE